MDASLKVCLKIWTLKIHKFINPGNLKTDFKYAGYSAQIETKVLSYAWFIFI